MKNVGMYTLLVAKWSELRQKPIRVQAFIVSTAVWGLYLVYSIFYCQLYVTFIAGETPELSHSFIWALREYGLWVLLTPYLLIAYSLLWPSGKRLILLLFVGSWVFVLAYRVGLDCLINPEATLYASIVYFTPNHLAVAVFVLLGWALVLGPVGAFGGQSIKEALPVKGESTNDAAIDTEALATLRVLKGACELEVPVVDVECISAAGNYMEVDAGCSTYLLRATMKDLEQRLSPHQFVRVHRSHLVNLNAIERFCSNNEVLLRSGKRLPTTRRYSKFIYNNQLVS